MSTPKSNSWIFWEFPFSSSKEISSGPTEKEFTLNTGHKIPGLNSNFLEIHPEPTEAHGISTASHLATKQVPTWSSYPKHLFLLWSLWTMNMWKLKQDLGYLKTNTEWWQMTMICGMCIWWNRMWESSKLNATQWSELGSSRRPLRSRVWDGSLQPCIFPPTSISVQPRLVKRFLFWFVFFYFLCLIKKNTWKRCWCSLFYMLRVELWKCKIQDFCGEGLAQW